MSNEVFYDGNEYYLSYLEVPSNLCRLLDEAMGSSHVGRSETAICIREPWACYILYDDHREALKPIAHDLDACKKYWLDHKELHGHTSDSLEEELLASSN